MDSRRKIILILAILPLMAGLLAVGCDQNVGVGSPVEPDLPVATATATPATTAYPTPTKTPTPTPVPTLSPTPVTTPP